MKGLPAIMCLCFAAGVLPISSAQVPETQVPAAQQASLAPLGSGTLQGVIGKQGDTMSLVFRDVPVTELFEMLSRKERVSIILQRGVSGNVTVNLYDTTLRDAIYAIADAAGYAVEERAGSYVILDRKNAQPKQVPGLLEVRPMSVQYSNPKVAADIVARHVGPGGRVTLLEERRTLVVEDTPENLPRLERLLREVDRQPAQILIEAKILEITLDTSQQFGIDWAHVFGTSNRGTVGARGLAGRTNPGLFFNLVNSNIELYLSALSNKGRVNTLATPKLLTLENQEAVTNIGDKIGYKVTTTINNISTESIQFLETGVILRVTPSVDAAGRIAMKIRPEVSSGSIAGGIPSKKTTEVTTQLIAEDGQSILIGGLIKNSDAYRRSGVPVLSDIPGVGALFSSQENIGTSTETIVIITPKIMRTWASDDAKTAMGRLVGVEQELQGRNAELSRKIDGLRFDFTLSPAPAAEPGRVPVPVPMTPPPFAPGPSTESGT